MLNTLKEFGNKVVDSVKKKVLNMKEEEKQNKTLKKWQDLLALAQAATDLTIRDEREMIYLGTADTDANINSKNSQGVRKKANNVVNIVLEFIETMVDSTIPQPSIRTKLPGFEDQATMIEDSLAADITELGITAINDVNERVTPVQGLSAILVNWNPDFKHHLYRGELALESVHPKRIVPQPEVFQLQAMDYFFILSSVTKTYIKNRYDVDMEGSGEQFPGLNSLEGISSSVSNNEMLTEIVCWYKNDDGDVSKFTWCDDEILEDVPNFYARRIDGSIVDEETLDSDVTIASVNGQPGEVLKAGTKVPYFIPTRYPLIVRENIPLNFAFGGQSDVDVIRDQQDAMKKVVSTIEEKIIRGTAIITALEGHRFNLTNELYAIVRGTQSELSALNIKNLSADIANDMAFAQQQYRAAQSTLGITNSFQGKADTTATSGVAKQIQVQQASGRLRSKESNKYAAFKETYEIMFEFKLAFYDELRPFVTKDANGQDSFGDFNKYSFLVRDKAGELYYNTDFIFQADAGSGLPRDKMWLFSQANEQLKYGGFNATPASVIFWTQMVAQKYPNAKIILDTISKQMESMAKTPPAVPKVTTNYKDMMPDAQAQFLQKLGIKSQGGQPLAPSGQEQTYQSQVDHGQTPPQGAEQSPQPQQGEGEGNAQPDVRELLEGAMQNMTPEEQAQFKALPDEQKITIIQEMMANQGGQQ